MMALAVARGAVWLIPVTVALEASNPDSASEPLPTVKPTEVVP